MVLGFFNEDPRQPVIIGALFGPTNTPPARFKIEKENKQKGLVSRKGALVGFDDEKARIYIETPKSTTSIVLDGDEKKILLSDQNGNTITMDKNGITMKTAKDFKLEVDGKVDIKGSKVDIK